MTERASSGFDVSGIFQMISRRGATPVIASSGQSEIPSFHLRNRSRLFYLKAEATDGMTGAQSCNANFSPESIYSVVDRAILLRASTVPIALDA